MHEIIGPLVELKAPELLMFTRMTGDLVKAMRACPQPIVAAIDGVCAGAGAILAMASRPAPRHRAQQDRVPVQPRRPGRLRHGRLRDAAAHHRPGPRQRAALHRPRAAAARRRERWGFFNRLCAPERAARRGARRWRATLAAGPTFANGITKTMLHQEWAMTIEQAIEAEAQAQAICMLTEDFTRAYEAFVAKQKPRSKATEMADTRTYLDWPFFERRATATLARASCDAWARGARRAHVARHATSTPTAARSCASLGAARLAAPRRRRHAHGGARERSTRAPSA